MSISDEFMDKFLRHIEEYKRREAEQLRQLKERQQREDAARRAVP